jgi:hypothetical protein
MWYTASAYGFCVKAAVPVVTIARKKLINSGWNDFSATTVAQDQHGALQ